MMDFLNKRLMACFIKPFLSRYLKSERRTKIDGFTLTIRPSVFHPGFFFSSIFFYSFIKKMNLDGKSFLDMGCGTGILGLLAYRKKAIVTCADINTEAVECARLNFKNNFNNALVDFTCLQSDLFEALPVKPYNIIVINPPYFFKKVTHKSQYAWNCGENGEYFKKLFFELPGYINGQSEIYMTLADNCDIEEIKSIASGFRLELVEQKKIKWEMNFIFRIYKI